eukprot:gene7055-8417_t
MGASFTRNHQHTTQKIAQRSLTGEDMIPDHESPTRDFDPDAALLEECRDVLADISSGDVGACEALAEYVERGTTEVEAVVASDGIKVIVDLIQGVGGNDQGLMHSLMAAASQPLTAIKVAAIRALKAIAQHPAHRGAIAGSGVLGMLSLVLLAKRDGSPLQPPLVRALVVAAIGHMALDHPMLAGQDLERDSEFEKLRQQLLDCGIVRALLGTIRDGDAPEVLSATLTTLALLCQDAAVREQAGDVDTDDEEEAVKDCLEPHTISAAVTALATCALLKEEASGALLAPLVSDLDPLLRLLDPDSGANSSA